MGTWESEALAIKAGSEAVERRSQWLRMKRKDLCWAPEVAGQDITEGGVSGTPDVTVEPSRSTVGSSTTRKEGAPLENSSVSTIHHQDDSCKCMHVGYCRLILCFLQSICHLADAFIQRVLQYCECIHF